MFEALLLAAAQAAAPPPASKPQPPPSAELLEFLADWSEDEASLIDEETTPASAARAPARDGKSK